MKIDSFWHWIVKKFLITIFLAFCVCAKIYVFLGFGSFFYSTRVEIFNTGCGNPIYVRNECEGVESMMRWRREEKNLSLWNLMTI